MKSFVSKTLSEDVEEPKMIPEDKEEMTEENIKKVKELSSLAPLHNPAAVKGIQKEKVFLIKADDRIIRL